MIKGNFGEFRLNVLELFPKRKFWQLFTSFSFLFAFNILWYVSHIPMIWNIALQFKNLYVLLAAINLIIFMIVFTISMQLHILIGMYPGEQAKNVLIVVFPLLALGVFVPGFLVPYFLLAYSIVLFTFTQRFFPDML